MKRNAWLPKYFPIEDKLTWFRIGDVATNLGVKPYVIRYWESEFGWYLKAPRTSKGQRWYQAAHIERLVTVRDLLWVELYTIAGAKRQLRLAAERSKETA